MAPTVRTPTAKSRLKALDLDSRGKVEIVIPVYRPGERLLKILDRLARQDVLPERVRLICTGSDGMEQLLDDAQLYEEQLFQTYPFLEIRYIHPEEFDHAGTRDLGMRLSMEDGAQYVVMMTQDALPADRHLIYELIKPFGEDEQIAVTYARQLPNHGAGTAETISRQFNYPDHPQKKTQADFDKLGIKTYFCSNVCAAYRTDIYQKLGGFTERAVFNEDMIYAGRALQAGYAVYYNSNARVYHSHHYSALQQLHRNFDLGASQADHPEIFGGTHSEGEGVRYVREVIRQMNRQGETAQIPGFAVRCGFRLIGYKLGRNYRKLPGRMVETLSSNRNYWKHVPSSGNSQKGK